MYPPLTKVEILPNNDKAGGIAAPDFITGYHKVKLSRDPDAPRAIAEKYSKHPASLQAVADKLGFKPTELLADPQKLYAYVFLHELGHTVQYDQYDAYNFATKQGRDYAALPVPDMSPRGLQEMLETADGPNWVTDNWEQLQTTHAVETTEELVALQGIAYRQMFHESFADDFAVAVMHSMQS